MPPAISTAGVFILSSRSILLGIPLHYNDIIEDIAPESLTALAAPGKSPEHIQGTSSI